MVRAGAGRAGTPGPPGLPVGRRVEIAAGNERLRFARNWASNGDFMSQVILHDPDRKLSATLLAVADALPPQSVTLRDLLTLIGEQGLLLLCVFLCLPFLIPVSIPGVSTVFGLAIIFIGLGVTFNRLPWFPRPILNRPLPPNG